MDRRKFMVNVGRAAALAAAAKIMPNRLFAVKEKITLTALGDCIISRKVSALKDPQFLKIIEIIRSADCTWANCEQPIVDISKAYPTAGGSPIYCEPYGADELKWLGVDCVGLANNHTWDYGYKGILSTIEQLKRVGIGYAGAGKNLEFAAKPGYVDTVAGRIGQVNCAGCIYSSSQGHASMPHPFVNGRPGFNPLKYEETVSITEEQFAHLNKIQEDIANFFGTPKWIKERKPKDDKTKRDQKKHDDKKQAKEEMRIRRMRFHNTTYVPGETFDYNLAYDKKDIKRITDNIKIAKRNSRLVIASVHDHMANSHDPAAPLPVLEDFAKACIDAGADAFFGTGPHWLLGIEIYKKKPIFYSLGNFFFHSRSGGQYSPEFYQLFGLPHDTRDTGLLDEKSKKILSLSTGHWESIVPFITYANENELEEIKLYPVVLGREEPIFRHGTPALAEKKEAESIIEELAKLSEPYKTAIEFKKGIGTIKL